MLPDTIDVTVTDRGSPCCGALIKVELVATRKNNFWSTWGPTDVQGKVTIRGQELLDEGLKDRDFFLMDYGHPDADFSGQIRLRVATKDDLQRAIKAYGEFSPYCAFRPGYLAMMESALRAWNGGTLQSPRISAATASSGVQLIL